MKFLPPEGKKEHHLSLLSGHTAHITEEGSELPVIFRKQAIADGCEIAGVETGKASANGDTDSLNEDQKMNLIMNAIDVIMSRDLAEELTSAGDPKVAVVSKEAGFTVTKEEVTEALRRIEEDTGDGEGNE